jgi:plastocyanin
LAGLAPVVTGIEIPLAGAGQVAAAEVQMKDVAFLPAEIHVKVGDAVTWHDADEGIAHTVTAVDKTFDSSPLCGSGAPVPRSCMGKDDTFTTVFVRPGHFPYYCRIHGGPGGEGMAGMVVVE